VPLRTCSVSFVDNRGIRHSVEVQAETLFEAAVLALQILKKEPWSEPVGAASQIHVEVREPVTQHVVTMMQVERWLSGSTPNPADRLKKDRLKQLLKG
jgi:hypothetical protein